MAFAEKNLAKIKCPVSIDFVEELPRTPTGKLLKRRLKDKNWQGTEGSERFGKIVRTCLLVKLFRVTGCFSAARAGKVKGLGCRVLNLVLIICQRFSQGIVYFLPGIELLFMSSLCAPYVKSVAHC